MRVLKAHPKSVIGLAFSPDGRYLASASNDGSLFLHDSLNDYRPHRLKEASSGRLTYAHRVVFSPDGSRLVRFDAMSGLHTYDTADWSLRSTWLKDQATGCDSLACSPTDPLVLTTSWTPAGGDRSRAWDPITCQEVKLWPGRDGPTHPAAFDATGARLACGDGVIRDVSTGKEIRRVGYRPGSALAWSGGPRPLLAAAYTKVIDVFDPETAQQVGEVRLERLDFLAMAFTPDGRSLITVSNERTAKTWDTATWRLRETLEWRVGKLKSLAVSPDGMRAAAGSERGRVVVWDLG